MKIIHSNRAFLDFSKVFERGNVRSVANVMLWFSSPIRGFPQQFQVALTQPLRVCVRPWWPCYQYLHYFLTSNLSFVWSKLFCVVFCLFHLAKFHLSVRSQAAERFFFIHLSLERWWGRKSKKIRQKYNSNQRSGLKTKILRKSGQNQTQSRFKDLLEEDSEAESRPDPNHILAFTRLTTSSLLRHQLQCYC